MIFDQCELAAVALTIIKQTSRVLLLCWFFFWLLLLFFSSSLLDRERLSGLPGKGRSSGRRRRRRRRHPQCYGYWSNVIVHRAGLIKTNCHRPDHLSQDSLRSEPREAEAESVASTGGGTQRDWAGAATRPCAGGAVGVAVSPTAAYCCRCCGHYFQMLALAAATLAIGPPSHVPPETLAGAPHASPRSQRMQPHSNLNVCSMSWQ